MFDFIALYFLSSAVLGGACWLGGYWHGRVDAWKQTRKQVAEIRERLWVGPLGFDTEASKPQCRVPLAPGLNRG